MLSLVAWFFVQLLILLVILRYGKPIEEDIQALIMTKLYEAYRQQEDEELRFQRRMQAYQDIAEQQLMMIIRTMVCLSDIDNNNCLNNIHNNNLDLTSRRSSYV